MTPTPHGFSRLCAAAILALCLAGAGPTAAAAADLPTAAAAAPIYPREFGYVTMKDGIALAYVAYLPAAKGRFPTVLQYGPYQGGGIGPDGHWLQKGYAVVTVSVRGTGCSQGAFDLFGPQEGPDGAEVVDWISRQPWSDRKIGMTGVSYPGHTQILTAAQRPEALKAITPGAVTASTTTTSPIRAVSSTRPWLRDGA
jgi:predicted acyl esterase